MKGLVIDFNNTGSVESMHKDNFDLGFLGSKRIERATEILFDDKAQLWYISRPNTDDKLTGGPLWGFQNYDVARDFEVQWINQCRLEKIPPFCEQSVATAERLRSRFDVNG